MATNPATAPAPWGEYAPSYGVLDTDTYLQLPDEEGWVLELHQGRVIRQPGPGYVHGAIQGSLITILAAAIHERIPGNLLGTCCYVLLLPDATEAVLSIDVSFMSPQRQAAAKRRGNYNEYYEAAPDLAIEIASPGNETYEQVQHKIGVFLAAGVPLVWVVWPNTRTVEIWRPAPLQQPSAILHMSDTLDGQEIIPGFTCLVSDIFG